MVFLNIMQPVRYMVRAVAKTSFQGTVSRRFSLPGRSYSNCQHISATSTEKHYVLPTIHQFFATKITILDPRTDNKTCSLPPCLQDVTKALPALNESKSISEPSNGSPLVRKEAQNVLKYRRRRMNRHKLKKLRKRMKHHYARVILKRKKRKEDAFVSFLDGLRAEAEKFDPERDVREKLQMARKGGFKIDLFADNR
ncbi:uncharacterized protein LOC141908623 [Tubulanus polymorphus]|uniref:uncharacterized protein LOC141908623 n=1 Tax=Tubulanus polymorphus TaxID=672921 RepID=UPI003DA4CDBB